jgi:hypothetical protein
MRGATLGEKITYALRLEHVRNDSPLPEPYYRSRVRYNTLFVKSLRDLNKWSRDLTIAPISVRRYDCE